jgi:hypothetical protein
VPGKPVQQQLTNAPVPAKTVTQVTTPKSSVKVPELLHLELPSLKIYLLAKRISCDSSFSEILADF